MVLTCGFYLIFRRFLSTVLLLQKLVSALEDYDIINFHVNGTSNFSHLFTFLFFRYRFVRPSEMGEQRINQYIEGKYGKIGVQRYGLTST